MELKLTLQYLRVLLTRQKFLMEQVSTLEVTVPDINESIDSTAGIKEDTANTAVVVSTVPATSAAVSTKVPADTSAVYLVVSTGTAANQEDVADTANVFSKFYAASIVSTTLPAVKTAGITVSEVHTSGAAVIKEDPAEDFSKAPSADTVVSTKVPDDTLTVCAKGFTAVSIVPADTGGMVCSSVPDVTASH